MINEGIRGHIILLMAPTGSGKGVIVNYLKQQFPELYFSISCTTRKPRPGEVDGRDYFFLTRDAFDAKVASGDFLEWAEFGGNKYGTLKSEVVDRLHEGKIILNEIELQGIEALKSIIAASNRTVVYIEAGGWEVLRARAEARAPISEEELELRYQRYLEEKEAKAHADVVINNGDGMLIDAQEHAARVVAGIIESMNVKNKA